MNSEDIRRINHILYTSFRSQVHNPHCLIICYILFFCKAIVNILRFRNCCGEIGNVLFFVFSNNNKKAVNSIIEKLPPHIYSIWGVSSTDLPWSKFYYKALLNLKSFHKLYSSSTIEDKKLMRYFYWYFMLTVGYYEVFVRIIKNTPQLQIVLFSNDHITMNRCMIEAAKKCKIKTLYVQHASVTEKFPPLCFSYSFLDGMESYEKYKSVGKIEGKVYLTGSPRFDELYVFKKKTKGKCIGIALNLMDDCQKVLSLCVYLKKTLVWTVIVRPHPLMGKDFPSQYFTQSGIEISDSTMESSFAFLSRIRYLVANESSIHLDAALMDVPSVLFNFSNTGIKDWYSYIKNGFLTVCNSYEEVLKSLNENTKLPIDKIRYYNSSYQTNYEGKIGNVIAKFILKELSEDGCGEEYMNTIASLKGEYYQLRG